MQHEQVKTNSFTASLYPNDILNIFENMAQDIWKIGVRGGLPCKGQSVNGALSGLIVFFTSAAVERSINKIFDGRTHTALVDIGVKAFGIPIMLKTHNSDINSFVGTVYMERPEAEAPLEKVGQKQFTHHFFDVIARYKNHVTERGSLNAAMASVLAHVTP